MKSEKPFKILTLTVSSALWILVIFLLLVELSFKISGNYKISGVVYDKEIGWRSKRNHHITKSKGNSGKVYRLSTNSKGFRDITHRIPKDKNTKRILILGDSYTFGGYVSDKNMFTRLFEKMLNKKNEDTTKYEIITAAIPAWATDQQLLYLKQEGTKYKPDYIFLMIAPNDIRESYMKKFFYLDENGLLKKNEIHDLPLKAHFCWWLSNHSSFYQFIQEKLLHTDYGSFNDIFRHFPVGWNFNGGPSVDHPLFLKEKPPEVQKAYLLFKAILLKMHQFCVKHNHKLILVVLPTKIEFESMENDIYQPGKVGRYTENIAIKYDIPFLDLFPILNREKDPLEIFIPEEFHFDNDGHIFVAKQLYDFFVKLEQQGTPR